MPVSLASIPRGLVVAIPRVLVVAILRGLVVALLAFSAAMGLPAGPTDARAATAQGTYLATFEGDSALYHLDLQSRRATLVGRAGEQLTDVAFLGHALYGIGFDTFYRINTGSGAATTVSSLTVNGANALVAQPGTTRLYGATTGGRFFRIIPSSGDCLDIGEFGGGLTSAGDMAFLDGRLYAAVNKSGEGTYLALVDPSTGQASLIGDTGFEDIYGLAPGPGVLYGATYDGKYLSISTVTGAAQVLWNESLRAGGLATYAPVAAPVVVLVAGLGSNVPTLEANPAGGDWKLVKQRLQEAGFQAYAAATRANASAAAAHHVINSSSSNWRESAARLDRQLVERGLSGRPVILVGHSMGGLISRVYAETWRSLSSGCRPLGIVQLGTPNKGSEAAGLAIAHLKNSATKRLASRKAMAAFNAEFKNREGLPIYRIAGKYFPRPAARFVVTHDRRTLLAVLAAVTGLYGSEYNDSLVTVDSVRGGPTAGWRGCAVFNAVHADMWWLLSFRANAGCLIPHRTGRRGGALIDTQIMARILLDVYLAELTWHASQ